VLHVRRLGQVTYAEALDLQHALARRADDDYLLLLEHPHVYTMGVHADPAHVLDDPASVGATLFRTDRGGDVTYHGPGQLVAYPIVTLEDDPGAGRLHVGQIEQVVIDALGDLGVEASRQAGYPGVWIGAGSPDARKIAAIGVRTLRVEDGRRRAIHGVALNVECDLEMFGHIVPCGIADYSVTSLRAEGVNVAMGDVIEALTAHAVSMWGADGTDRQDVQVGGARRSSTDKGPSSSLERPALRRLREAGTDPDRGVSLRARKPEWLRVPARMGKGFLSLGQTIHDLGLVTVCEEAGCPNIFECWADGTATFMVNGSRCTRACGFCLVDTRHPMPLDPEEPERVAEAIERMHLAHAVVTCVARDDLPDGGAGAMAETIRAIRRRSPRTAVEVLISDYKGDATSLQLVLDARPDVLNHNVETVARLQRAVRPSAGYARSLTVLGRAADAGLVVKSGLMVGLGESEAEVASTLGDMASVGVSIATIGQYLRPSSDHLPVARWWSPAELDSLAAAGRALGIAHIEASPLARSSYHAKQAADAAAGSAPLGEVLRPGVPVPVPQRVGSSPRVR